MVKFRGKPRKKKQEPHVAGETGVVQTYSSSKSGFSLKPKSPFKFFGKLDKTGKLLLILLLLLTGAVVFYGIFQQDSESKTNLQGTADGWTFVSQEESDKLTLKQLKDNPPDNNATSREVTDYYINLIGAQANLKDYEGAIDSFNDWESAGGKGINHYYLISVAGYYHEIEDDDTALLMLKRAKNALPATDDPNNGYYKSDALSWIDGLIEEYEK